jgi:hypothetical protein
MIPNAIISAPTMIRMKTKAARLGFADETGGGDAAKSAPKECKILGWRSTLRHYKQTEMGD